MVSEGSEFKAEGPATENAFLASFVLVLGWAKRPRDAEHKRSSLQMLHESVKYEGAEPWTMSNINTYHCTWHVSVIGSQCRFWSSGVARENTGCKWMTRAALFSMRCSHWRTALLQSANSALQWMPRSGNCQYAVVKILFNGFKTVKW